MRKVLLLSNSRLPGYEYLEYCKDYILDLWNKSGVKEVLFVPYASVESQQKYTELVRSTVAKWGVGIEVKGLNEVDNAIEAVNRAQGIFVGGGNTFLLLKLLQENNLIEPIRRRVLHDSIPYVGISAGTNVGTVSINTTNDMPIVHVPSFAALCLIPFNINPHYVDHDEKSTHQGETREMRITEYHQLNEKMPPVLGLREGTFLRVEGDVATTGGLYKSRLFRQSQPAQELEPGTDVSFLLKDE